MADSERLTVMRARELGQGSTHLDADPTYARVFARRVSPYLSWVISAHTPLSADAVTVASIGVGIVGGLLVGVGTLPALIVALVLLQSAYLLDVVDGEVARIRGTASRRGTYLDLIGHFLQNRALYAGAGWSLIVVAGPEPWAIGVALLTLGLSVPFGHYARTHVLAGSATTDHPDHGAREVLARPAARNALGWLRWGYRRVAFLWNYPAAMNLFSIALLVDIGRLWTGEPLPLAVPALLLVFGPTLAAKQILHAVRLLRSTDWS